MIVSIPTKYQIKTNVKTLLSYRNKNVSTTTRMNMDDNLNKEILDERNQQDLLAIPGKIKLAWPLLAGRRRSLTQPTPLCQPKRHPGRHNVPPRQRATPTRQERPRRPLREQCFLSWRRPPAPRRRRIWRSHPAPG